MRLLLLLMLIVASTAFDHISSSKLDEMWLRQPLLTDKALRAQAQAHFRRVVVESDVRTAKTLPQLWTAASELTSGLTNLLGRELPRAQCCNIVDVVPPGIPPVVNHGSESH